jgi:hypothetical protein
LHATSLQGFGYDDVVHQFENLYNAIAMGKCWIKVIKKFLFVVGL